jgi:hypothetical protein
MKSADLYAVQHIRRMRGGSQAHLIRASDNNFYIVKFQNNPQHIRALASEYLGSRLGVFLGLPMPEVRVIDVSEWLIANTPELRIESAGLKIPCATGLQLASRYVADVFEDQVFDYMPESIFKRIVNQEDFPRVLVFDKWTANCDGRQAVFVRSSKGRSYRAFFIDQGHCFNAGEWTFPDLALHGVYFRNSAYRGVTGWQAFEPVLSRVEQIDLADLDKAAEGIPDEWYRHDSEAMTRLLNSLHERRFLVRELINRFRTSRRNPFPGWTST